ncbi:LacI family DNA-binding transcriptional regulator [Marinibacterium sp. SX1]|uniref:LacI family DNA-binding transcriptional regulator n=1 Tax=Marinibacterium sp. SX1 TaxID=3388424 RepID=UPI003D17E930
MTEPTSKPARLKDVARHAGLAAPTVSRFLNGAITLPEDTVKRINAAITALNYRPNPHARSLSLGRSDTIGLALPDIANPFFSRFAAATEAVSLDRGRSVILSSTLNRIDGEAKSFDRLSHGVFDGLLFATNRADDGALARLVNDNAARVVLVDEDIPGTRVPKVFSDNDQGGALAGEVLVEAGHRDFAYIGGPENLMSTIERGAGFARAVAAAGPGARIHMVAHGEHDADHGRQAMHRLLDEAPEVTALFTGSDAIFMGALEVMRARGLRPGREISVVTFDDMAPLDFMDPPITAIRHPIHALADAAVGLLCDRLTAPPAPGDDSEPACLKLPVALMRRASVGPPPGRTGR